MLSNPFTPVFGGKPDFFFGRKTLLARFKRALVDKGSEDRALFITGTRGSGKTALVEQLSEQARSKGWLTIDLGPENTVHALVKRLAGYDAKTKTVSPQLSVNVFGAGGSLGGVATSKTAHIDDSDLDLLLIEACEKAKKGVVVTIDEVQKLSEPDISAISNAFQMASRKGCDAILIVAGLPFSHDEIIAYRGCTFLRRAVHERIGLLSREEVVEAFASALEKQDGLELPESELDALVQASYGHPYMVQLLGFYLVERLNEKGGAQQAITAQDVSAARKMALSAYESRALRPMLDDLSEAECQYLGALARVLNEERIGSTADVARELGKEQKQLSPTRDRLLKYGIVIQAGRGQLMFTVPYLASYLLKGAEKPDETERLRAWGV